MHDHIAKLWADALQSGKFRQGHGKLTRPEMDGTQGDCCLGVLCKLAIAEGVPVRPQYRPNDGIIAYDECPSVLPKSVQGWAGMKSDSGALPGNMTLTHLNDNGLTFHGIAHVIRHNWEHL